MKCPSCDKRGDVFETYPSQSPKRIDSKKMCKIMYDSPPGSFSPITDAIRHLIGPSVLMSVSTLDSFNAIAASRIGFRLYSPDSLKNVTYSKKDVDEFLYYLISKVSNGIGPKLCKDCIDKSNKMGVKYKKGKQVKSALDKFFG